MQCELAKKNDEFYSQRFEAFITVKAYRIDRLTVSGDTTVLRCSFVVALIWERILTHTRRSFRIWILNPLRESTVELSRQDSKSISDNVKVQIV